MRARGGRETALESLDWSRLVPRDGLVVWGQASAEPASLTASLMRQRARIGRFQAFVGISWTGSVTVDHADHVSFLSYCASGNNRRLGDALDILPIPYSALAPRLAAERPTLLISLGRGRDEDHFSFGAGREYLADLLDTAALVIAEVSDHLPSAAGTDGEVAREQIDIVVRTGARPPAPDAVTSGIVEQRIAARIADLVEDGSTLQIGLGNLPATILDSLRNHRDLGIHSGMIGDEVAELAQAGVITNRRKTVDRDIAVTGLLAGGDRLMRWADANPGLALRPTSYTHDTAILASQDRLVAINSAIEVDLSGQINAEVAGGRYVGAVGGGSIFLRGALASRGGLPIVALPSEARGKSRIVAQLSGPVSTARADAGIIVTEHGIADLRGLTLRQRREKMLAICAPAHIAGLDAAIG